MSLGVKEWLERDGVVGGEKGRVGKERSTVLADKGEGLDFA